MENSSLQEGVNLKCPRKDFEKEVKDVKDLSVPEPKDILERHSGEPGEPGRIQSFGPLETNLAAMMVREPEVVPFPYADTKLRPEAPPFTPECVSPNPESYGEPDTDNSCFVNVDLKLPTQEEEILPEIELSPLVKEPEGIKEAKDACRLKPFSITSTPQLKQSPPDIEIPEAEDEEDPIVAVRATTSTASETRDDAPVTERVRILSPAFFFGNKTQIVVLVASILVCVILVIFVLV